MKTHNFHDEYKICLRSVDTKKKQKNYKQTHTHTLAKSEKKPKINLKKKND